MSVSPGKRSVANLDPIFGSVPELLDRCAERGAEWTPEPCLSHFLLPSLLTCFSVYRCKLDGIGSSLEAPPCFPDLPHSTRAWMANPCTCAWPRSQPSSSALTCSLKQDGDGSSRGTKEDRWDKLIPKVCQLAGRTSCRIVGSEQSKGTSFPKLWGLGSPAPISWLWAS